MLPKTLQDGLNDYGIGAKIRALRLKKKIGLVDLGKHTGLSPALLSKIERGRLFPTLPTLLRIALVFGVGLEFMGSMVGLVLSDNVIALFGFWELTGFTSYLLIGFDHERPQARRAATQALFITGGGGRTCGGRCSAPLGSISALPR